MKKNKINSMIFCVVALLCYVVGIDLAFTDSDTLTAVWMCLGTTFLCIAFMYNRKSKDNHQ